MHFLFEFFSAIGEELSRILPDAPTLARSLVRLGMAVLLVSVIGWNRERGGHTAGFRTHLMVGLGAALFVLSLENVQDNADNTSRIIQGIAAGVGFIGGGAILKIESENRIRGLTTAASIWLAAAVGVACGVGKLNSAILGTAFAWVILAILGRITPQGKESPIVLAGGKMSREPHEE